MIAYLRTALCLLLLCSSPALAGEFDFLVIQPGQPGTTADAQPVMDEFAAYLSSVLGQPVQGGYVNDLAAAEEAMASASSPAWSIMGLGFYLDQATGTSLTPLASTLPAGREHDGWHVLVLKDGIGSLAELSGAIQGSMLFDRSAACLLFGSQAASLDISGTNRPAKALRALARKEISAVVIDAAQHAALDALPMAGDLEILHSLAPLPTSPVVWFGEPSPESQALANALLAMRDDPLAQDLLELLQTSGFGPPAPDLADLLHTIEESTCD